MKYIHVLSLLFVSCLMLACYDSDSKTTDSNEQTSPTDTDPINPIVDPIHPVDPVNPTDPTDPTDPVTPDDPTPSDPVTPDDPTDPTDPVTPDDPTPSDPPDAGETDPCTNVKCTSGTCSEGVCVTSAMKKYNDGDTCNPETFVEFCDGNVAVYCDHGAVTSGACDEKCVVYSETYFGLVRQQAGCIDGGDCSTLNALKRSCSVVQGMSQVLTTACQKTTRNTLKWVSVDGYYCAGTCDGNQEKCALTDGECDPYDASNYSCDRSSLTTCHLDSSLIARTRTEYCDDKCIQVNGISMCGFSCDKKGERSNHCVHADSQSIFDSGEFVCTQSDSGELFSIWNGEYSLCETGCNGSTGVCN